MRKNLGVGVGLRTEYYSRFVKEVPDPVQWIEVNAENYIRWDSERGDGRLQILQSIRQQVPVVLHGTSMSLGTPGEDNTAYLRGLKELIRIIDPELVSDHVCWSSYGGVQTFDLLPVPMNEESLKILVERISAAQDFLGRQILVENPSTYFELAESDMTEWDFISEVCKRAGCFLLLDINNVFVSSSNHGWNPKEYLAKIPHDKVFQIHLAGHRKGKNIIIDTHDNYTVDSVWSLYKWYIEKYGPVSSMIEWDSKLPPWEKMAGQLETIKAILSGSETALKRGA